MLRMIASTTRSGEVIFAVTPPLTTLLSVAARRFADAVTLSIVIYPGDPRFRCRDVSRRIHAVISKSVLLIPRRPVDQGDLRQDVGRLSWATARKRRRPSLLFIRPHHHLDLRRWLA